MNKELFSSEVSLALVAKDLRTAAELAEHVGVPAPLSRAVSKLWNEAEDALGAASDHTEMFRFLEMLGNRRR